MSRIAVIILFSFLLMCVGLAWKTDISTVAAFPDIYQGNLVLTDNNVTTITGRFDINGSIIVEENATLVLTNAVVNFTQSDMYQYNVTLGNPSNGNPRLQAENDDNVRPLYAGSVVWEQHSVRE